MGFVNDWDVPLVGSTGGLTLWWDDCVEVKVVLATRNLIHRKMRLIGEEDWFHTSWVYGTPYRNEKHEFWQWMSEVLSPTVAPWICAGDFNEMLSKDEKSGGSQWFWSTIPLLQSFMNNLELMDLGFSGPKYTWRGTKNGSLVQERLDHGLINVGWQCKWPNSVMLHENARASNNCPLILNTDPLGPKCKPMFRFEAFWFKNEGCRKMIANCWNVGRVSGGVDRWNSKLRSTRGGLLRWSADKFRGKKVEMQKLNSHLGHLQLN